jgi:hypothetical protein
MAGTGPDWLRANYRDAQGRPWRIVIGATEQALHDHAAKHGKAIEQTHQIERTRNLRSGSVTTRKTATVFYGLMSA